MLPVLTSEHDSPPGGHAAQATQARLPRWLKRNVPKGNAKLGTAGEVATIEFQ